MYLMARERERERDANLVCKTADDVTAQALHQRQPEVGVAPEPKVAVDIPAQLAQQNDVAAEQEQRLKEEGGSIRRSFQVKGTAKGCKGWKTGKREWALTWTTKDEAFAIPQGTPPFPTAHTPSNRMKLSWSTNSMNGPTMMLPSAKTYERKARGPGVLETACAAW